MGVSAKKIPELKKQNFDVDLKPWKWAPNHGHVDRNKWTPLVIFNSWIFEI
jgi:hypothetical protein